MKKVKNSQQPTSKVEKREETESDEPSYMDSLRFESTMKNVRCQNRRCIASCEADQACEVHRHTTFKCYEHVFCKSDRIPEFEDKSLEIAYVVPNELHEKKKLMKEDDKVQGEMSFENLKKLNSKYGFFFKEKPIPGGKKILVTESNIDQWLAAHFGMKPDNVPLARPHFMSRTIHDRLKKQFLRNQENREVEEKDKMPQGLLFKDKQLPAQFVEPAVNAMSATQAQMFYPPEDFVPVLYPMDTKVKSVIDDILEEENINKLGERCSAQRFRSQSTAKDGGVAPAAKLMNKSAILGKSPTNFKQDKKASTIAFSSKQPLSPQIKKDHMNESKRFQMTTQSSIKIKQKFRYKNPKPDMRKRLNSESLRFLNYNEIQRTVLQQKSSMNLEPKEVIKEEKKEEP